MSAFLGDCARWHWWEKGSRLFFVEQRRWTGAAVLVGSGADHLRDGSQKLRIRTAV